MSNLIWCKCRQWQDWINVQDIELGQPMLKNDKSSALLDLEERCDFVTYAHPKLRGFDIEKQRYYLPINLNQVLDFFNDSMKFKVPLIQYEKNNVHIKIRSNDGQLMHEAHGKTWYDTCTKILKEMF